MIETSMDRLQPVLVHSSATKWRYLIGFVLFGTMDDRSIGRRSEGRMPLGLTECRPIRCVGHTFGIESVGDASVQLWVFEREIIGEIHLSNI